MTADEIRRLDDKHLLLISTNLPVINLERYVIKFKPTAIEMKGCGKEIKVPKYERIRPRTNETTRGMPPLPDLPDGLEI